MTKPTPEQIAKLPQWARAHIANLSREREMAVRRLDEMTDNQTKSPFRKQELDCTETPPVSRTVYFQARSSMEVEHAGVELRITLRENHIDLQWSRAGHMSGSICSQPSSHQAIALFTKENMR